MKTVDFVDFGRINKTQSSLICISHWPPPTATTLPVPDESHESHGVVGIAQVVQIFGLFLIWCLIHGGTFKFLKIKTRSSRFRKKFVFLKANHKINFAAPISDVWNATLLRRSWVRDTKMAPPSSAQLFIRSQELG